MARNVVVLTTDSVRNGVLPIVEALVDERADVSVIDTSSPISLTINDAGEARLKFAQDSSVTISSDTSVLSWRARRPCQSSKFSSTLPVDDYVGKVWSAVWTSLHNIPARWVNPGAARVALEHDKGRQAYVARMIGLETIPTLLTNDVEQFDQFIDMLPGDVALKSPVGWHHQFGSGVHEDRTVATYTRRITKSEAISLHSNVDAAPFYVQPYIEKSFELRITVIGRSVFSCKIDSQAATRTSTDWRHYDFQRVPHTIFHLDSELEDRLVSLVAKLGLAYAAIDMIVDLSGTAWFVELNPSGHYGWIESLTGAPISRAIAHYLAAPSEEGVVVNDAWI